MKNTTQNIDNIIVSHYENHSLTQFSFIQCPALKMRNYGEGADVWTGHGDYDKENVDGNYTIIN